MNLTKKSINYLKALSAETISNAKYGHTGVCLGAATMLFALFKDHYQFDTADVDYLNRDRFVLSAGHASALHYSLLSMFGFDVSLQDLKEFRTIGSKTPALAEYGATDGIEFSTGVPGQGVANAVGLAIAEAVMEERFNTVGFEIIKHKTYCFVSDADIMEGVAMEAASIAGSLALKNLILLYDSNAVTADGVIDLANRENVAKKFSAMGFKVIHVANGSSYFACTQAISRAKRSTKPTLIIFSTIIGEGTEKEGTSAVHSAVLSNAELAELKEELKVKESFFIPSDVREFCMASARRGKLNHEKWNQNLAMYSSTHPELYKSFMSFFDRKKINFERILKNISKYDGRGLCEVNHHALSELAYQCPQVIGGSADAAMKTRAFIDNAGNFSAGYRRGKNLRFGVREHAMSAIISGVAMYEDFICFESTTLSRANMCIPAIRLRNQMQIPAMSFFTHDSIACGVDGSSAQPVEQIGQLRSIVGSCVFRPCDARELVAGYNVCIDKKVPVCFVLGSETSEKTDKSSYEGARCGGYVIGGNSLKPSVILVASGSEVFLALSAAKELSKKHAVSVVSMPSIELFEKQNIAYKTKVLAKSASVVVAVEASNDTKWLKVLGERACVFGVEQYVGSGDGASACEKFGFNEKNLVKFVETALKTKK